MLSIYLDEYPTTTPWDALKYLIAGVSYGGHVTDDWDRRLLTTYINQYFCEDALNIPYFRYLLVALSIHENSIHVPRTLRLSSVPTYYIPRDGSLQSYIDYVVVLPNIDKPEAFGQHPNADITSLISETRSMCETLMSLQVQVTASAAESKEEKVYNLFLQLLWF